MARASELAALMFVTFITGGCVQSPARLDFNSEATSTQLLPAKADAQDVYLAEIEDVRIDKENIGFLGPRSFRSENLMPWFDHELHTLAATQVRLVAENAKPSLIVRPRLLKLYVEGISVTKTAVVVMEVTFTAPTGVSRQTFYRGQYAGVNWWNSEAEIKGALQKAMENCLGKCLLDMDTHAEAGLHPTNQPVASSSQPR